MKRILFLALILIILLCGCKSGGNTVSNQTLDILSTTQKAQQEYEHRLKQASGAVDLSYIKINDIIIDDPAIIQCWIDTLQTSKVKSIPYEMVLGEEGFYLTLGYSDKEVSLGVFFSDYIGIKYDELSVECLLEFQNDAGVQIRQLAKEAGFKEHQFH